jgi:hypothetical protein
MDELTVVQGFEDRTEAELACGLLIAGGLSAVLEEHELLHGVSDSLPIQAAVGVMVPADQLEQARQLLADARNSGGTQASDVAAAAAEAKR